MSKKRLTTIKITSAMKYMETEILKVTRYPKTLFHKYALEDFLSGEAVVEDRFKIKNYKDPLYVRKDVSESIYLEPEMEVQLREVAKQQQCGYTIVIFQALLNYCLKCAEILDPEVLKTIIKS